MDCSVGVMFFFITRCDSRSLRSALPSRADLGPLSRDLETLSLVVILSREITLLLGAEVSSTCPFGAVKLPATFF